MKITLEMLSNAGCLYTCNRFNLLADPWLSPYAFEGAWAHCKPLKSKPQDLLFVDATYVSHAHFDHMDYETLKFFPRNMKFIVYKDRFSICERKLKEMGFDNIIALSDRESLLIGPFLLTMFGPFVKHPFFDSQVGNVIDSALLIEADGKKIINFNDNTPSIEAAKMLAENYGPFNISQQNFNNASEYPCMFINLSEQEKINEASKCIKRNLDHMAKVGHALGSEWIMPFAGSFMLSEKLAHKNHYLGTCSAEFARDFLREKGLNSFTLEENEIFELE